MKKNLLTLSAVALVLAASAQTPRLSLYEEFTGETCPPCASTNPGLNVKLAANASKIVAIKWQVPIPSAPSNTWSLYQTNKTEIDWRWRSLASGGYGYTPAINSAPSSKIDGQEATVFGASSGHPANLNNNVISTAQSYTSAFSVTMNRAWGTAGAINLTVSIVATAPFTSVGNLVFRTVMVERLIQFSVQPGTNGEKDFEDVAIRSYPTLQNGVAMAPTWTVGQTQTFTLSCMPPTYVRKKSEIAFVGFIQDDGNQKVAQAVRADKQALPDDAQALSASVPVVCSNTAAPTVNVKNLGLNPITSMVITPYVDGVMGNTTSWSGNLAPGASTVLVLNSVTVPTVSGSHTFSYNISSTNNPDVDPTNNTAKTTFMVASNFIGTPVSEGFSVTTFPPSAWTMVNANAGPSWSRVISAGAYQMTPLHSIKYDFYNNGAIGDQDELYLPAINLTGGPPVLSFDISYAQRTQASADQLDVFLSDNCGATWTNVYSNNGSAMATSAAVPNSYIPADLSEWTSVNLTLNNWNKPNVICKFVTTSDKGNNLYLDNINLSQTEATGLSKVKSDALDVKIYPNPSNEFANISVASNKLGSAKITVMNAIGQVVYEKQVSLLVGSTGVYVDVRNLAAGVYNVTVDSENAHVVSKLTVSK